MLTGTHILAVIVYFILGYIITKMLQLAEQGVKYKNGIKKYSRTGKAMYISIFIILMLFVLLQEPRAGQLPYIKVFKDSTDYRVSFFSLTGLYSDQEMEPMFLLWCFLIRCITDNAGVFLAVSYGFVFYAVLKFISVFFEKKYTFTFMLFWPIIIDYIFGMRYGLACAYCFLAAICYKRKKYIPAVIFTVVASFTHFLAIAFVMYIGYCIVIKQLYKYKIFSIKTLVLSAVGVFIFSKIAVDIYATFRVAYRMSGTISLRNFLSYLPQAICAWIIFYYQKDKKFDRVNGPCVLAAYFNMVMIPITIQWGIYRLPYIFLPFCAMALTNSFNQKTYQNVAIMFCTKWMLYAYCTLKIITMGLQNESLNFTFLI